jgi:DNA-binding LacI/PurR family transcriptional regulator
MTVSNVMRGRSGIVAPETTKRVLAAVRELKYAPVAQPTIQSRHVETRTIGLVFDDVEIEDAWGAPTFRGMRHSARARGYDLLTLLRAPADWMLDNHELHFLDRRSDGMIFLVPRERTRVLETLVQHRIPTVSCFQDDVPPGVATVVLDNFDALKQATEYLIARGHRKILHIAGWEERSDFRRRREGYEAALRAARLRPHILQMRSLVDYSWLAPLRTLLERRAITAIVCAADDHALPIFPLAQELGLSIPHDFSITGMDDIPAAAEHGLTTFRFSCEDVGRYAVEAIVGMIAGAEPQQCSQVLPVEMVERHSVAPLPIKRGVK